MDLSKQEGCFVFSFRFVIYDDNNIMQIEYYYVTWSNKIANSLFVNIHTSGSNNTLICIFPNSIIVNNYYCMTVNCSIMGAVIVIPSVGDDTYTRTLNS